MKFACAAIDIPEGRRIDEDIIYFTEEEYVGDHVVTIDKIEFLYGRILMYDIPKDSPIEWDMIH